MINCVVAMGDRRAGAGHRLAATRQGHRLAAVHPPVVRQSAGRPGEGQSDRQDAARGLGHSELAYQPGVDRAVADH